MYHFIGIKGAGMSSLANIMNDLGYEVKGSDIDKHFFTEIGLNERNIKVTVYDKSNIYEGLTIIKGASITDDNVELMEAKRLNLEIITYEEMVGRLTTKFKTICVSGCHGKTTTTAMLSISLPNTNYLIGDGTGFAKKENTYFALESCEYKRHFLNYTPYYLIITNIDLDHVDYFKDIDDVIDAYNTLANKTIKINEQYRGTKSKAIVLAIAESTLHEAGHAKDLDGASSIQEEINCLSLNSMAHRTLNAKDPGIFETNDAKILKNGVNLYSDIYFNKDLSGLMDKVKRSYGHLPAGDYKHPASNFASAIKNDEPNFVISA